MRQDVTLADRFDLGKPQVLLNGTQALVRLVLMQQARDRAAGLRTAGYVTGYRGSPLGGVDVQMTRAGGVLAAADIRFHPGLNEDLAATAIWGTQTAEARGEGRFDGVFGLWYGKGPGVDRSGDALRHGNLAGSSRHGGVLLAMGDDHTGESSTTCHQSEYAAVDAQIPILSPAGVQEILDFGLYGYALSRYSGLWVGLKLMKDTVESTAVVDARPDRMAFVTPGHTLPKDGLNLRLPDHWVAQEARLAGAKLPAALAFARANQIDRAGWRPDDARIGLVAAGKSWLDLTHALALLGIDEGRARAMGIATWKVGQVWPLEPGRITAWAQGLETVLVIEEKRPLIEDQLKVALFDAGLSLRVAGKHWRDQVLFPQVQTLDPVLVAERLGAVLVAQGHTALAPRVAELAAARAAEDAPLLADRKPYFCAGCPHNTSTVVPDGARAMAGIGCHTMALWMDRQTSGLTQMGAEGSNWIGEAGFSSRAHVFQNMGDGTYNHSGLMAVRAAVMAEVNITYKILFNDAVAMTGGQANDGGLTAPQVARELLAAGVRPVALVHDPAEALDLTAFPPGLLVHVRDELPAVQARMQAEPGCSAILYVQTCAAEKRRKRKRGSLPDPDLRVWINPDVCEGCGDCGVQSNCVAILPLETPLGRKRQIDQSACNKDVSCLKGFCPSFVTVQGGTPRRAAATVAVIPALPMPDLPGIHGTHNTLVTGIGGTGVVTLGAVLTMAAHLDGKGAAMIEVTGMAQKGGAVLIHCRIADTPADISAIRLAAGECDLLLGGDLVVSGGPRVLSLLTATRTRAFMAMDEVLTGDFTRSPDLRLPGPALKSAIAGRCALTPVAAGRLAKRHLGDAIFANMVLLGAAWQAGALPLTLAAIDRAIELNGAEVAGNARAFAIGRWAMADAAAAGAEPAAAAAPMTLAELVTARADHLCAYQGPRLAARYRAFVGRFGPGDLALAVAQGYHKLLSCKDEYEVARLHLASRAQAQAAFDGPLRLTWHLAPPILSRIGPDGRPTKRAFGGWIERLFPLLAALKPLRGTMFDPFGHSAERKMERALIAQYEADMTAALAALRPDTQDAARALAALPMQIRGFGPVKAAAVATAAQRRAEILATLHEPAQVRAAE